jgi:glucans biosynthesis protein C
VLWVDWLRVIVVFGILLYHSALPFTNAPWIVNNRETTLALDAFAVFCFQWGIPLMFLLAGAATRFGLRSRPSGRFLKERTLRLLLPLVFGILLLSPPQAYLQALSRGQSRGSFLQAYPDFLGQIHIYWSPRWFGDYGYHLWFLAFLLVFSAAALPVVVALQRPRGARAVAWFADWSRRPYRLLLVSVPLAGTQVALRAAFPLYEDWADLVLWLCFFVLGYVLLTDERFVPAIARAGRPAAVAGIGLSLALGLTALQGWLQAWEAHPGYRPDYLLYAFVRGLTPWLLVIAILALGIRFLSRPKRGLDYANEAALPFYVIHHPFVVLAAFWVVQWDVGVAPKFVAVVLLALTGTVVSYELLVRRYRLTRAIFGLRPGPSQPQLPDARSAPTS